MQHPLRKIRHVVNVALAGQDSEVGRLYSIEGCPSSAPDRLIQTGSRQRRACAATCHRAPKPSGLTRAATIDVPGLRSSVKDRRRLTIRYDRCAKDIPLRHRSRRNRDILIRDSEAINKTFCRSRGIGGTDGKWRWPIAPCISCADGVSSFS